MVSSFRQQPGTVENFGRFQFHSKPTLGSFIFVVLISEQETGRVPFTDGSSNNNSNLIVHHQEMMRLSKRCRQQVSSQII